MTLWTLVNRNEFDVTGSEIALPHADGRDYFDVWNGVELKPVVKEGKDILAFDMEAHGYGAVFAVERGGIGKLEQAYFSKRRELTRTPLSSYSHEWHFLPQHIVEIAPTARTSAIAEGMVRIPAGEFDFKVSGIEIEGSNWAGLDVQYPWENPRTVRITIACRLRRLIWIVFQLLTPSSKSFWMIPSTIRQMIITFCAIGKAARRHLDGKTSQ